MCARKWLCFFCLEIIIFIMSVSLIVIFVDPFFHYHRPISSMYYKLNNQRSQNDGIIKRFEYDSIISGTSMCENFKTSEFDEIFQTDSIKVCFSGASYKEINDNLEKAFNSGHDVKYILNKEVVCDICIPMLLKAYCYGDRAGITSFDEYSNWNAKFDFGAEEVLSDKREYIKPKEEIILTTEEQEIVKANIEQNVIRLAEKHPETTFYYFFSPYSVVYWADLYEKGMLNRQINAEKIAIEQILKCENIKLYSFNNHWYITTNLNNYKDNVHYGEWINTEILKMIYDDNGLLTKDNYEKYINKERNYYLNYSYQFSALISE